MPGQCVGQCKFFVNFEGFFFFFFFKKKALSCSILNPINNQTWC